MANFPFVGPSYTSQSLNVECQRSVNFYLELVESQRGKDVVGLYPTPGLKTFCTLSGTSVRAIKELTYGATQKVFAVSGTDFVEIASDGTVTVRGTVANDGLPASIAASQNQLVIISGGVAYSYTISGSTFATITGMLGTPFQAEFVDGYFIVLLANSKQFQFSGLLDATAWDGLDTAIISVFSGNVVSMIASHRELWFLGKTASQVYYDSGNADMPFEPTPPGFIEQGSGASWATVKMKESVLWLSGSDRGNCVAYRSQGYQPVRVSNHATEYAWSRYSAISDAIGYAYEDQGHSFWVIHFPTADATWTYDIATGEWHERGFWLASRNRYEAHHSRCHTFAFGKHLVGDWKSGKVYEMDIGLYDDDGSPLRRLRRAPHISKEQQWMFYHQLQIDVEVGLGLVDPALQGFDPQIILRWSNDGGKTWSNDHFQSAGKVGLYKWRAIWRRLGRSRDRVFEIHVSDPIPWRIAAAYVEASTGTGA